MSYILEALRRAEAERQLGANPGLGSQTAAALPAPSTRLRMGPAAWTVGGAAVVLALAAGWWVGTGDRGAAAVSALAPADRAPADTPQLDSVPPRDRGPAPSVVAEATPEVVPAPTPSLPVNPSVSPPVTAPAPPPNSIPAKRPIPPAGVTAQPEPRKPAIAAPTMPAAPAARSSTVAEAAPVTLEQLPSDIRQQLPAVALNGISYSANAAYRMAILNGQVLHEGEEVAPGVRVERIEQHTVVLRFRGYRYGLSR